jgi:hypothetical protein
MRYKKGLVAVLLVLAGLLPGPGPGFGAEGDRIGKWTGSHTRLVWLQDQGDGSDTLAYGQRLMLYGYDSKDGRGERPLLPNIGNYFKPLITPDGRQVIVSNRLTRQMYLVEWDTGKVRELGEGVAVAVWEDPKPSLLLRRTTTWVYSFSGPKPENEYGTSQPLFRFPLDKPKKKELIWDKTDLAWDNIQLSRDGQVLGGQFPWPDGGVLWTKDKRWQRFSNGCWASLSPDNSKLLWIFDGLHRNIRIHEVAGDKDWTVNINGAPGIGGFEVYHPRWSNHPRYFVVTGPYEKGDGGNRIRGGGEKVEIYIGRFAEGAQRVEDWIKATDNRRADFYPDLWIAGGDKARLAEGTGHKGGAVESENWPASPEHLVFVWENMKAANQLADKSPVGFFQCNLELRGRALYTRDFRLTLAGGFGETGAAGKKIAVALARTGKASVEFVLSPASAQQGTILAFAGGGKPQLWLAQQGDDLLVHSAAGAAPVSWPGLLVAGKALHLVVNLDGKTVELFADGRSLGKKELAIDFSGAAIDSLNVGDPTGALSGILSGIAVYDQPLGASAIATNSRLAGEWVVAGETATETLVVEGRLGEMTEIPAPDAIGAYRRALVVNSYSVDRVVQGQYGRNRILVAEWAILDRQIIKKYQTPSQSEQLVVEKFADHPELEGERQMMDVFEPELEMYYRLPQPAVR